MIIQHKIIYQHKITVVILNFGQKQNLLLSGYHSDSAGMRKGVYCARAQDSLCEEIWGQTPRMPSRCLNIFRTRRQGLGSLCWKATYALPRYVILPGSPGAYIDLGF